MVVSLKQWEPEALAGLKIAGGHGCAGNTPALKWDHSIPN
jgi:hypothetical protein